MVIPGHTYVERDLLHPMTESRTEPPEWCERPLEQVMLGPRDVVDIQGDKGLVYDGNRDAEIRVAGMKKHHWL